MIGWILFGLSAALNAAFFTRFVEVPSDDTRNYTAELEAANEARIAAEDALSELEQEFQDYREEHGEVPDHDEE